MDKYIITGLIVCNLLIGGLFTYLVLNTESDVDVKAVCDTTTSTDTDTKTDTKIVTKYKYRYKDFYDNNEPSKAYWTDREGVVHEAGAKYSNKQSECARLHDKSLC